MVPSVCFNCLAANRATLRPRVAEKRLFYNDRNERHDGGNPFWVRLFSVLEGHDGVVAETETDGADCKADSDRNQGLEAAVPVRVVCIGWSVPETGPYNNGDVGGEIRGAVDGVCDQGL